jgi:NitT/TauT family transport system ATP-binding protein
VISFESLGKVYKSIRGDIQALSDVNLTINSGEFVSLVGPSGCGKSTLLRCLAGLEKSTSGRISFNNSVIEKPPSELGIVFQRDVLLDWRTVIDNVLVPLEFRGTKDAGSHERALELLNLYGLGTFENRYPWELSGGMRQRVAICRAMITNPELLLMDEPFGALDAFTRDELNLELQKLSLGSEATVVFVTHSIPEAVFLSDRVIVMAGAPGRIVLDLRVDLPRPRALSIRDNPEFVALSSEIRNVFERLGLLRRSA